MNVALTEDQRELAAVVRSFLNDRVPAPDLPGLLEDGHGWDTMAWRIAATQLGLQALAIPEEFGGAGFSVIELGVCLEEMGRALWSAPFFSSIGLAAPVLLVAAASDAQKELLPGIASGDLLATLAVSEDACGWDIARIATRAEPRPGGWTLSGDKTYVVDGQTADVLLVAARTPHGGTGVFAVDAANGTGVHRQSVRTLDPTRGLATVQLRRAPGRLLNDGEPESPGLQRALDISAALLSAEQVGGAARVLEMAVSYARDRHQFGRPIGSFQAVKHRCANMLVALEGARSAAYAALHAAAADSPDLAQAASLAKWYCSESFTRSAADNVHIHGGIGMTWEHAAHLYLKRARSSEMILGSPRFHRRRLARLIWPQTSAANC